MIETGKTASNKSGPHLRRGKDTHTPIVAWEVYENGKWSTKFKGTPSQAARWFRGYKKALRGNNLTYTIAGLAMRQVTTQRTDKIVVV